MKFSFFLSCLPLLKFRLSTFLHSLFFVSNLVLCFKCEIYYSSFRLCLAISSSSCFFLPRMPFSFNHCRNSIKKMKSIPMAFSSLVDVRLRHQSGAGRPHYLPNRSALSPPLRASLPVLTALHLCPASPNSRSFYFILFSPPSGTCPNAPAAQSSNFVARL